MLKNIFVISCLLISLSLSAQPKEGYKLSPPRYVCYKTATPIVIDGEIYGGEWDKALWSSAFVDIRGAEYKNQPIYTTRMKMMWDNENLYIAGELPEPHIWATLTKRDATIYFDNDFELFLDPDGDTHNYFEFEINAFGTEWDLMMTKPYRFGGTYINGYTMHGLESAVKIYGTINDPSDKDDRWVVEIKIPFKSMINGKVKAGDQWRMNFSRVEWLKVSTEDGTYKKLKGTEGFGHEENWVWAPTGAVDIHRPEYWGFVQFSDKAEGSPESDFVWNSNEDIKFELRRLLNMQLAHHKEYGKYAKSIKGYKSPYKHKFYLANDNIVISIVAQDGVRWYIANDSRVWRVKNK